MNEHWTQNASKYIGYFDLEKKNTKNQTHGGPMQHPGSEGSHKYQVKERMNLDMLTMWTRQKFTVVLTRVASNKTCV